MPRATIHGPRKSVVRDPWTVALLMSKMPLAGKGHRNAGLIAGRDHVRVADRAAGLDDGLDLMFGRDLDRIRHRKESVASEHRAFGKISRLLHRDLYRIHA